MKPPILRQRMSWQYWKLTLIPLAVGTVIYLIASAVLPPLMEPWLRAGLIAIGIEN